MFLIQGNPSVFCFLNQGYPPNSSSAHSPDKDTLCLREISFASYSIDESISAIPGASLK